VWICGDGQVDSMIENGVSSEMIRRSWVIRPDRLLSGRSAGRLRRFGEWLVFGVYHLILGELIWLFWME
jgi:hypothetical protein